MMGLSDIPTWLSILFWLLFPGSLITIFTGGPALFTIIQLLAYAAFVTIGLRFIQTKSRLTCWFCFGYPIVTVVTNIWPFVLEAWRSNPSQ